MKDVKCADCDEYRNEWCEKVVDSPYPDMIRDCQYWHKRKDLVEVIRCKDCEYYHPYYCEQWSKFGTIQTSEDGYCHMAERKSE